MLISQGIWLSLLQWSNYRYEIWDSFTSVFNLIIPVVCVFTNNYESRFLQAVCEDTNSGYRLKQITEKATDFKPPLFYYIGACKLQTQNCKLNRSRHLFHRFRQIKLEPLSNSHT
jgi:hypothetical protein